MDSLSNKLKEKDKEITKLQESLQFHSVSSRELQQHLDVVLNEKILQQIDSRIDKCKKQKRHSKREFETAQNKLWEWLQLLQTQDDAAITVFYTSLKQKDDVALMTKTEEYKGQKYCEFNQHLEQERELCQKDDIINSIHKRVQYVEGEKTVTTMRDIPTIILVKIL